MVANSYDAIATNVHIIVPRNLDVLDAVIWVVDDGQSMDAAGLFDLWRIAASTKRLPGRESKERPPIGRFGIGKLATYVLAKQLTYVCKRDGKYRAVTMDYSKVDPSTEVETKIERLPLRRLTEDEARALLAPLHHRDDEASQALPLFGAGAAPSWTVALGAIDCVAAES